MPYKKFIRYGNNLEVYEYEREPIRHKRTRRKNDPDNGDHGLGADREDTLSERQLGNRQNNSRRSAMAFRRLVSANLSGTELPVLITLTYEKNVTDIKVGYKNYRSFVQALRHKYGKAFRYICVPEFQRRGAVHFHAMFWGLPSELLLQERKTRELAMMWGHGFVYMKKTDGHERLSSYLAKYMSKAFVDSRLKNQKSYVASKNIQRPVIGKDINAMWHIEEDFSDGKDVEIKEKEYHTSWLGMCKHRHFKLKENL